MTLKALSYIDNLSSVKHIVDFGCGTGSQTMILAEHTQAKITAIDLFPEFIEILKKNAAKQGYQQQIEAKIGSMDNLEFNSELVDLIWSEGAIYNIGFEHGLKYWHKFLKIGGYLAVTDASWFSNDRPLEIQNFWTEAYPEIDTIPNKLAVLQNGGFVPVACFILPEYCWTENFYQPQLVAQKIFLDKYPNNQTAIELVNNELHEADLYDKYKQFYGYVFYIGRKI